jgi:hypothetical protein
VSIGLGGIDVFASWAVEFYGFLVGDVGESDGEERLGMAVYTGTSAKVGFPVLLELRTRASASVNSGWSKSGGGGKSRTILPRPREVTM